MPTRPGAVNEVELSGAIKVDALPVSVGTSGAPLISQNGILGMIVTDAGAFSEATPLEDIRRAIEKWNYPWQLVTMRSEPSKPPEPNPTPSTSEERPISVWKVGSPHTGETPDTTVPLDLELSAEKIGRKVRIQAFPAKGFAQTFFSAFKNHQEPDILAIDNYGIINGITTPLGDFTGIGSSETIRQKLVVVTQSLRVLEGQAGGFEFLLSTSKNYDAAKLLSLRSPECNLSLRSPTLPHELHADAARIASAYLRGDGSLKAFEDVDRLETDAPHQRQIQLSETKECGFAGNEHLAFVPMIFSYESEKAVGQIPVLVILRRVQKQWKLLASSTDFRSNTNTTFLSQIPELGTLLQKPFAPDKKPIPAQLIAPEDGQPPQHAAGQRFGDFIWEPSTSTNVVAEIIEFAHNDGDAQLYMKFRPGNSPAKDQVQEPWFFTRSLWKWRVWSISDNGVVSFSKARSFTH